MTMLNDLSNDDIITAKLHVLKLAICTAETKESRSKAITEYVDYTVNQLVEHMLDTYEKSKEKKNEDE